VRAPGEFRVAESVGGEDDCRYGPTPGSRSITLAGPHGYPHRRPVAQDEDGVRRNPRRMAAATVCVARGVATEPIHSSGADRVGSLRREIVEDPDWP